MTRTDTTVIWPTCRFTRVAPGVAIRMAEAIGASNDADHRIYVEACGTVAAYFEPTEGHHGAFYLREDLARLI